METGDESIANAVQEMHDAIWENRYKGSYDEWMQHTKPQRELEKED